LGNFNLFFVEQPHVKGFAILIDCTVVAAILIFVLVEHSKTEHIVLTPRKRRLPPHWGHLWTLSI